MVSRFIMPLALFLMIGVVCVFCTESSSEETAVGMFEPMPAKSDTFDVAFRDTNFWVENDSLFCVTGLVDNKRMKWQKIWLKIDLKDEKGGQVEIKGMKELVLRAFSEAIPPLGASSFFYSIPLDRLSARPKDCTFTGAASLNVPEGPILILGMQSNVKAFTGMDTTSNLQDRKESAWLINCEMNNPLPMPSDDPRLNVLIYGRDQKLWFSQVINPEDTISQKVVMKPPAPIGGGAHASAYFQVTYTGLPKVLEEVRIGRVDVMLFDAREGAGQSVVQPDSTGGK